MALVLHFRRKVTQIMQNVSPRFDFLREKISTTALRRFFRDGDGGRWRRAFLEMAAVGAWQPPKDGCIIVAPGWLAYLGLVVKGIIYRRSAVV